MRWTNWLLEEHKHSNEFNIRGIEMWLVVTVVLRVSQLYLELDVFNLPNKWFIFWSVDIGENLRSTVVGFSFIINVVVMNVYLLQLAFISFFYLEI